MMNVTLLSLSVSSIFSMSPFLSSHHSYQGKLSMMILNSCFTRSINSVLYSTSSLHHTVLKNDKFSHMLNGAIKFVSDDVEDSKKLTVTKNKNFNETITFNDADSNGDLTIASCTFEDCRSQSYGGGILVEQNCSVILHDLIFDSCVAEDGAGGYICAKRNERSDKDNEIEDGYLEQVDVQYCCFQNCRVVNNNIYKTGFGGAMMIASINVVLFYTSTVRTVEKFETYARGAQFDIQSHNVSSQNVNATGGFSKYCGSIEYRSSLEGFFKFQTITMMDCMFVTAFSQFQTDTIDISFCNLLNNTVSENDDNTGSYPAMVHVRNQSIIIKNFAFIDNVFNNDGRIASKQQQKTSEDGKIITLKDCYSNGYEREIDEKFIKTENCNFKKEDATLNSISQLYLGECKGNVPPSELIITASFTPSYEFTESGDFTESAKFTKSGDFTGSKEFSQSDDLHRTSKFTKSNTFTSSKQFSKSGAFSQSAVFTQSNTRYVPENTIPIVPVIDRDLSESGDKLKPAAIAGIAVGVAAAAGIAALVAFFVIKKRRLNMMEQEELETFDSDQAATNTDNPIYNQKGADDPFKEDFQN